jgi:hypothetical protein
MSVNDTALCQVAKKICGVAPEIMIDDPVELEKYLIDWTERFNKEEVDLPDGLTKPEFAVLVDWWGRT